MTGSRLVTSLKRPYIRARDALGGDLFDRCYAVETGGAVDLAQLGLLGEDREDYAPAFLTSLPRILPRREVSEEDVFIDFGSGKGRVVLQAALWYRFRRVYGVELSERLHEIAQRNVERVRGRLRCPDVRLVRSDVLDFDIPDDVTVAFLYNPFRGRIFEDVLGRLLESVDHNPRPLRIVYGNPQEEAALLRTGRVQQVHGFRGWRPGRDWSRTKSYRSYVVT